MRNFHLLSTNSTKSNERRGRFSQVTTNKSDFLLHSHARFIDISHVCKQVALQFPDELLCVSVPIYLALKHALENEKGLDADGNDHDEGKGSEVGLYVLADTSYGRHADPFPPIMRR